MLSSEKNVISCSNVSFKYAGAQEFSLKNVTFGTKPGKLILLCGPTGSGKSTFIKSLNGLIPHHYPGSFYGYLKIGGRDTVKMTCADLSKRVGVIFQNPENQLFASTVEDELAFGLENVGCDRTRASDAIEEALRLLGIEHLRNRSPLQLSGGEQQKVALASILVMDPDIIALDEPLSNLEPLAAQKIIEILVSLKNKRKKTILIAEHHLEDLFPVADDIILMQNGKVVQHGPIRKIIEGDPLYQSGLNVPQILGWFRELKKQGVYAGPLPLTSDEQLPQLRKMLGKNPRRLGKDERDMQMAGRTHPSQESGNHCEKLVFSSVSYTYPNQEGTRPALNDASFAIRPGEIIGLLGPNGAGKSTLLRCANGLICPDSGTVWFDGVDIRRIRNITDSIGLVFQNPRHQLFLESVERELSFSLRDLPISEEKRQEKIDETLSRLGIFGLKDRSPFSLSGGEEKLVSIATILCRNPEVLIFDEPTIGQDANMKLRLSRVIRDEQQKGKSIILVTHDVNFISELATRIIILLDGEIYADGRVEEILDDTGLLERCSLKTTSVHEAILRINQDNPRVPTSIFTIRQLAGGLPA